LPLTPAITLTATLDDLTGAAAGSLANPAKLRICLCGFGPTLPRISGTAMLAKVGPFDIFSTGGVISTLIWGNDVITPSGTYYSIEILDGEDNVVQCGAFEFLFLNGATQDLSSATQIVQPLPPQIFNLTTQVLIGNLPGTVFTIPTPLLGTSLVALFYRGVFYGAANYTVNAQTVTMNFACTENPVAIYIQALA
jgi:hypothetical protein